MRTYFPQQNRGPRQTRESSNAVYLDMAGGSAPPTYSECCESEWKGEAVNNTTTFSPQLMQSAAVKMLHRIEKEEKQGPLEDPANELKHRSNLADAKTKVLRIHNAVNMNAEQIADSIRDIEKHIEQAEEARGKDTAKRDASLYCMFLVVIVIIFIIVMFRKR